MTEETNRKYDLFLEYKERIIFQLEFQQKHIEELERKEAKNNARLSILETKAALFGLAAGAIISLIFSLINKYL